MLQEAIDLQKNAVESIIKQIDEKPVITFKAPTGSGKTYMMADLMNQVLEENENIVFLVSTLSKGGLAKQNYDKFVEYKEQGTFAKLNPYLISTETSEEEALYIPTDYNVYLLPRDLYKKGGRLMQGAMENFLQTMVMSKLLEGEEKTIYLIKDECHQATNNLDTLRNAFFAKTFNFSATPNLRRGQKPDVEITDTDAVNTCLIKKMEIGNKEDSVEDAINKFEEIKVEYRNHLGVNPCLIIQISNKEKADDELNNSVFPVLNKAEHQDLKWMLIVDDDKKCDTNDVFKAKKLPVSRWKDFAKENSSTIDIIIFKMVISEGWDIPRACMIYQLRESEVDQLNEQVIGRVRRNPRLLDYETLSDKAKNLATTAWVWGNIPEGMKETFGVKLYDEPSDITKEVNITTTKLKPLTKKADFDLENFISSKTVIASSDIFALYKKMQKMDNVVKDMCKNYSDTYSKWFKFAELSDKIQAENNKYVCNYEESMEVEQDDSGNAIAHTLPIESMYVDNKNYLNISDWVWKRKDGHDRFSFDSEAEREWANILKDLTNKEVEGKSVVKKVKTGKKNPKRGQVNLEGYVEPERIDEADKYIWGKNYLSGSNIKFEYYLSGIHSSFPDFIMKDGYDRIHLFETKSVNVAADMPEAFDSQQYLTKIEELKKCYRQASKLTNNIFYLPILKDDVWQINQFINGNEFNLTKEQFIDFVKNKPE